MKATLYGVSVGPGDPELLTIKAVNVLRACQVIAAPVTSGEKTLALQIAQSAVDFSGKTVVKIPFIMSKDPQVLQKSTQDAADLVIEQLQSGGCRHAEFRGCFHLFNLWAYYAAGEAGGLCQYRWLQGCPAFVR